MLIIKRLFIVVSIVFGLLAGSLLTSTSAEAQSYRRHTHCYSNHGQRHCYTHRHRYRGRHSHDYRAHHRQNYPHHYSRSRRGGWNNR